MSLAQTIVVKFPWIPVLFLVPLCILYDLHCYLRLRINYFLMGWRSGGRAGRVHEDRVRRVQEQVQEWIRAGRKSRMCTARPSENECGLRNLFYPRDRGSRIGAVPGDLCL